MNTKKVTITETIEKEVITSNAADTARAYDISARARYNGQTLTSVQDGYVSATDAEPGASALATFSTWNPAQGGLSVNFNTAADRPAIMEAVEEYVAALADMEKPDTTEPQE